jgi:hypothetical protein
MIHVIFHFLFSSFFKTIVLEWEWVQQRKEENQKERANGRHDERRGRWVINKRGLSME